MCAHADAIRTLDQHPDIGNVLSTQRAISLATSTPELLHILALRMRAVGVREILEISAPTGGAAQVDQRIDLTDETLTPETIRCAKAQGIEGGPVRIGPGSALAALIKGEAPRHATRFDAAGDPDLARLLPGPRCAVSVPIFNAGVADEWLLVTRAADAPFRDEDVRVLVGMLNMLARALEQAALADQLAVARDRERAKIEEVAEIQRSLLPECVPEHDAIRTAVHYLPCDLAGGDYYDFRRFDGGDIGVALADVAGHGPGSAVVMAMLRTAMALLRDTGADGDTSIRMLNTLLCDGLHGGLFVTGFFLRLDPETGAGAFVNAGHCPPRILRASGAVEVVTGGEGPPLGILETFEADGGELRLGPGDTLVVFTDGINETFNPAGTRPRIDPRCAHRRRRPLRLRCRAVRRPLRRPPPAERRA